MVAAITAKAAVQVQLVLLAATTAKIVALVPDAHPAATIVLQDATPNAPMTAAATAATMPTTHQMNPFLKLPAQLMGMTMSILV